MKKTVIASVIIILAYALPVFADSQDQEEITRPTMALENKDTLSYQQPSPTIQGESLFGLNMKIVEMPDANNRIPSVDSYSGNNNPENNKVLLAQADADELSHQALTTAMQTSDKFYFVSASGTLPVLDRTFRDFVDYGATVSFGAGKRINDKLSLTATIGVGIMTGDWSIGGDRKSIEVAAEEYYPGYASEPGIVITPEDLPDENLGISYHGEAEAVIINAEAIERIDVHTDLYLFPVSINALYQFKQADKFNAYAGGGLGFCVATRDCDSRAIKSKYYYGPDYKAVLNHSQTVTGLLVNLVAGINVPVHERLKFVAEASTTLYDLNAFDPVLEISFTKPNPDWYPYSDLSQWSYEDPLRVGVYKSVYVTNISAGFAIPF